MNIGNCFSFSYWCCGVSKITILQQHTTDMPAPTFITAESLNSSYNPHLPKKKKKVKIYPAAHVLPSCAKYTNEKC